MDTAVSPDLIVCVRPPAGAVIDRVGELVLDAKELRGGAAERTAPDPPGNATAIPPVVF